MSILNIPRELIVMIGNYLDASRDDTFFDYKEEDNNGVKLEDIEYYKYNGNKHLRNLFSTCKRFVWMLELEFVCVEDSEFAAEIYCRNINGIFTGMNYSGCERSGLTGYEYKEIENNTSDYSVVCSTGLCGYFLYANGKEYKTGECRRPWGGTCKKDYDVIPCFKYEAVVEINVEKDVENSIYCLKNTINEEDMYNIPCNCETHCAICAQFNVIQNIIFEKDTALAFMFKYRENGHSNSILVREKRVVLPYFKVDLASHINNHDIGIPINIILED